MADDLWKQTADEYELTDEDVDYIIHCLDEDGDLEGIPEPTIEEVRAEVEHVLALEQIRQKLEGE